jgi:hypothetical protein
MRENQTQRLQKQNYARGIGRVCFVCIAWSRRRSIAAIEIIRENHATHGTQKWPLLRAAKSYFLL